jgi:hypothetical protein
MILKPFRHCTRSMFEANAQSTDFESLRIRDRIKVAKVISKHVSYTLTLLEEVLISHQISPI